MFKLALKVIFKDQTKTTPHRPFFFKKKKDLKVKIQGGGGG